jgi:PKD repeat protein
MSFLFVLALIVEHADAVPDIRGEYSGSYTTVVSDCSESGTYYAILSISIPTQTGNTFSGSATGTFDLGPDAIEYIQLSGTITETGQISGITSHTFLGTGGEGTFTGQLSGDTLSIENPGHDTNGATCTYIRTMSAIRSMSATYNATGKWNYSTSNVWNNCGDSNYNESGSAEITQNGNSVTIYVINIGITYTGSINGANYTVSATYSEEGGTTTQTLNFTLTSSISGQGNSSWTWTEPGYSCNGGFAFTLQKQGVPVSANFSADPMNGVAPMSVSFTDESAGSITSWSWNFGDGSSITEQNPSHTYVNSGTYTVSLTVTGPAGSDTETKTAYITVEPNKANPWIPLLLLDD